MRFVRLVVMTGIICCATGAIIAGTYWNGTRYVEDAKVMRRNSTTVSGSASERNMVSTQAINPNSYNSKEEFLEAYVTYELSLLTAAQRNEDRRILGGEKSRETRIRREGERIWMGTQRKTASSANNLGIDDQKTKDDQKAEDMREYLDGLPLLGLFGIKLGDVAAIGEYERAGDSFTYAFSPEKKFRRYRRYVFSVTPITHRIYCIRAEGMSFTSAGNEAAFDTKKEWEITKAVLEKKYNKKAKLDVDTMVCSNFRLLFPGADNTVEREIRVNFGSSITAIDISLQRLAERERQIMAQKQMDESIDDDLDAL